MKTITVTSHPKLLASFVSLRDVVNSAVNARIISMTNLSGYPKSGSVVGRIQNFIDLSSHRQLLSSLHRLRILVNVASDVLLTNPMIKIDKYQLTRTDVLSHIDLYAAATNLNISAEDRDFIAQLILSSDAYEGAWTLEMGVNGDNLFSRVANLYRSIAEDLDSLGYFDHATDVVRPINSHPIVVRNQNQSSIKRSSSQKGKSTQSDDDNVGMISSLISPDEFITYITIQRLAAIRVVDHVLCLLLHMDHWKTFITPRKTVDTAANLDRAKGLKIFAGYLQALLSYPEHFSLEIFLITREKIGKWVSFMPSIPDYIMKRYEETVLKYDIFDAKSDVNSIYDVFEDTTPNGSDVIPLSLELVGNFALQAVIKVAEEVRQRRPSSFSISNLEDLRKPEYAAYLLNQPVATFDLTPEFSQLVALGDIVSHHLQLAATAVNNCLPRFVNEESLKRLHDLKFRVPFGFSPQISISANLLQTTAGEITESGEISYSSSTLHYNYANQRILRENKALQIFRSSDILTNESMVKPWALINRRQATRLRNILGRSMASLYPDFLVMGDRSYSPDNFINLSSSALEEQLRSLFHRITTTNWHIAKIEMASDFIAKIYATYLSSFCSMYVVSNGRLALDSKERISLASLRPSLVIGYGQPYGISYDALASASGDPTPDELIAVSDRVFIRFHKRVPVVSQDFAVDLNFYMNHPHYYFTATTEFTEVHNWVFDEGALHFALVPSTHASLPHLFLDRRYVYLNDPLVMQSRLDYVLPSPSQPKKRFYIPLRHSEWNYDRFQFNAEYVHFGGYSTTTSPLAEATSSEVTKVIKEIEKELAMIEESAPTSNLSKENKMPVEDLEPNVVGNRKVKNDNSSSQSENNNVSTDSDSSSNSPKD